MTRTRFWRLLPMLALAGGAAMALSGCVAYPAEPGYGYGYGYGGPVVAPSVVVAPSYRPYRYYGWHGRRW